MRSLVLNVMTGHSGGEGENIVFFRMTLRGTVSVGCLSERHSRYILLACFRMFSFARNVEWNCEHKDARDVDVNAILKRVFTETRVGRVQCVELAHVRGREPSHFVQFREFLDQYGRVTFERILVPGDGLVVVVALLL